MGELALPNTTDPVLLLMLQVVVSVPPLGSDAEPFNVTWVAGKEIDWSRPALTTGGCGPVGLQLPALPAVKMA